MNIPNFNDRSSAFHIKMFRSLSAHTFNLFLQGTPAMSVNAIDKSDVNSTKNSDSGDSWNSAVEEAKELGIQWERPKSDKRSADDIIEDSALLKNLGNQ